MHLNNASEYILSIARCRSTKLSETLRMTPNASKVEPATDAYDPGEQDEQVSGFSAPAKRDALEWLVTRPLATLNREKDAE
jgi:hypothetical protein